MKWFVFAAGIGGLGLILAAVASLGLEPEAVTGGSPQYPFWERVLQDVSTASFAGLPVATGIAIFRHRLFDIDVIINKTVVVGLLAVFITAVYVAVVVGIGAAVGSGGNRFLPIVAAAAIAAAFQPVRTRADAGRRRSACGVDRVRPTLSGQAPGRVVGRGGRGQAGGRAAHAVGETLLTDLASQAGLILRNVRLIEELRASRQRLVVVKYAGAFTVVARLAEKHGELAFSVTDDRIGFDPHGAARGTGLQNMAGRMAAFGGRLDVSSTPGAGTTVAGRLPARAREPAV